MKNQKVQFAVVAVSLMLLGIWLFPSITEGKKEVLSPGQTAERGNPQCVKPCHFCCEEQRQGYSQSFIIDANSPLIEVPQGKCYVLLRVYARVVEYTSYPDYRESLWTLTLDGKMLLDEYSLFNPYFYGAGTDGYISDILKEDFPDKCVVVNGGETLGIIKNEGIKNISVTLIGYFYNIP